MNIQFTESIDEFGAVEIKGDVHLQAEARIGPAALYDRRIDAKAAICNEVSKAIDNLVYGEARLQLRELRHAVYLLSRYVPSVASAEAERVNDMLNGLEARLQIEKIDETAGPN